MKITREKDECLVNIEKHNTIVAQIAISNDERIPELISIALSDLSIKSIGQKIGAILPASIIWSSGPEDTDSGTYLFLIVRG
jgi:hypothetical protein